MSLDLLLTATATTTEPSSAALAAGSARLSSRIAEANTVVLAHRRRAVRRRRLSLSIVGAAAAAGLVVLPLSPFGGADPDVAQAAEKLLMASDSAAMQPDLAAGASYWHTVSEHSQSNVDGGAVYRRESWSARSGPGLLIDDGVSANPIGLGTATYDIGGTHVDWDGLSALTTDPAELRDLLLRADTAGTSRSADDRLFMAVGDLLRATPASPALRSALWRVAAQIPDVRLVGDVTDAVGRTGTAVEQVIDHGGVTEVRRLVFDPDTGVLLEETQVARGGGADRTYRSTYLDQGPADELPVQPQLRDGCTSFDGC
ncbi:CU044_5270 family protein [Cellulomonas timonensis]|uniref:CU044_5270 family protein n=1 Tax=Cellulomonas timonensis TaxID=1689271 RepID=UPI0008338B9B|nr:CU044_5270 family protein [Cellulomonas timonensis]